MVPGHLPYQFPVPEQPYFSHFYGDDQKSPEAPGHLPYSPCGPSQPCPYSDVHGTTGMPSHLSHSLPTSNVEYHYQGFHGCPGVPGHLLTQAQVHGQQNPYSGPPESPALSSPAADDLYASPINSVTRTPNPGMASSVSARAARRRRKQKKVAKHDGKTSWEDYHVQFELVAALNDWDEETKALELATSLRGTAQSILADKRTDYQSLVSALSARFEPEHQADIYLAEIRTRTRLKSESLPELGQVMKRLARYALPSVPSSVRQWLALTQFTEALDDEFLEYAVKQAKPKTVDEAVKVAMETEAFRLSRQRRKTHKSDIYMQHLDSIMAISKPKISRRRHRKGKVPQAKFEPRNQLDPDQDEVSMPEMYDGDGVLQGAMSEPYAEIRTLDGLQLIHVVTLVWSPQTHRGIKSLSGHLVCGHFTMCIFHIYIYIYTGTLYTFYSILKWLFSLIWLNPILYEIMVDWFCWRYW